VLLSAWIPAGPIDEALGALGRIVGRLTPSSPPRRTAWADPAVLAAIASAAGLALRSTTRRELAIRDTSPEAYVTAAQEHPMSVAVRAVLQHAGAESEAAQAMTAILRAANEEPDGFLVHSPYVVHELLAA
jgi:hypothetical protein